ncbi:MAG: hypothetical protein RTV72_05825 [Candidatus Thorarchaeota archaeon]
MMLVPWMVGSIAVPSLLISVVIFLAGNVVLLVNKDARLWVYSVLAGFVIGIGGIAVATLWMLSYIPVPIFGNALYATAVVGIVIVLLLLYLRPTEQDVVQTTPITTSLKSFSEQKQAIQSIFSQNKSETVLALELVEEPHDYIFSENEERTPSTHIERFSGIVRSLFSTPYSICYQQHNSKTRVYFTSWSNDVTKLSHQRTVLLDAIQYSLPKFKFRVLETFTGIELKEHEKGSAAIITGVPLSVDDESQRMDPLENIVGVLRELENGIFQVFVEPVRMSKSKLKKLEDQYKSEVMRSETVISQERSGLLHKDQQESRTSVNMDAKKKADILDRKIKRLSESNLYKTTVTALTWGLDIAKADTDAQRMAIALFGALKPDTDKEPFQVEYNIKRKDIARLMKGLPVGNSTILTAGEVTNYCRLTRRDLGLTVTKREKFSSGVKETEVPVESEDVQEEKVTSLVPTKVEVIKRSPTLFLGHPIDENGNIQSKSYITCAIKFLKMHLAVLGHTQSGKSTTLRSIFGQLVTLSIIPIMFLPSKIHEALRLLLLSASIRIFTCDRNRFYSLLFNSWNPPKNVRLSKWVGRVVHAWTLWLPNDPIISMHFEKVVYTMYERCGWDIKHDKRGRPILITDLIEALEEEQEKLQYGEEVSSNIFGALVERIKLIMRRHDLVNIINTKTGITVEEILAHPTVIDMDALSKPEKTLLMGLLTAAICEYKLANPTEDVTNVLILDEAHYLLGRANVNGEVYAGAQLQAIDAFVEMLRVVGGTGLGVILADQSPSSLVPEVMKIIVNVIVHSLKHDDDLKLVGDHARCTESQIDHIGGMQPGEAVVYLQHEGTPKNVMIFPLSRFVVGGLSKEPVTDEMVEEHMERIIKVSPNLADREPDEETIEPEPTEPADSDEIEPRDILLAKFPKELQERIKEAVNHPTFKEFCEEHLEKEDVNILTSLIHKISEKSGDGSYHSHLVVLNYLYQEYGCEESQSVFEEIAQILDGESG